MNWLRILGLCWRCANGGENNILECGGGDWWKEWGKWVFTECTTVFQQVPYKPVSSDCVAMCSNFREFSYGFFLDLKTLQ